MCLNSLLLLSKLPRNLVVLSNSSYYLRVYQVQKSRHILSKVPAWVSHKAAIQMLARVAVNLKVQLGQGLLLNPLQLLAGFSSSKAVGLRNLNSPLLPRSLSVPCLLNIFKKQHTTWLLQNGQARESASETEVSLLCPNLGIDMSSCLSYSLEAKHWPQITFKGKRLAKGMNARKRDN